MLEDFKFRIVQNGIETGKVYTRANSIEEALGKALEITKIKYAGATFILYKRIPVSSYLTPASQKRLLRMITMEELKELIELQKINPNKSADRELELIEKYGKNVKGLKK